jgi:hypothetical protein
MNLKRKHVIITALLAACLIAAALFFISMRTSEKSVTVLEYGLSVCTLNIPTSSCGQYDVQVQSADGKKATYAAAGFDNRDRKRYDEIRSKIRKAKEQHTPVVIKINNKGIITSVQ